MTLKRAADPSTTPYSKKKCIFMLTVPVRKLLPQATTHLSAGGGESKHLQASSTRTTSNPPETHFALSHKLAALAVIPFVFSHALFSAKVMNLQV